MGSKAMTIPEAPEIIQVNLSRLLVDDSKNLRRFPPTTEEIQVLVDKIRDTGWISPVLVKKAAGPNGEEFELVAGYGRITAIDILNAGGAKIDNVPAQLVDVGEDDELGAMFFNIAENTRNELSPIDAAYAISRMKEKGLKTEEIAQRTGKSLGWVSNCVSLLKLRPEIQKAVHTGEVPFRLARLLPKKEESEQDEMLAQLKATGSASEVERKDKKKKKKKNGKVNGEEEGQDGQGDEGKERGPAYLSSKKVVLDLEERVGELKAKEKETGKLTKREEEALELYGKLSKVMKGQLGVATFHKWLLTA